MVRLSLCALYSMHVVSCTHDTVRVYDFCVSFIYYVIGGRADPRPDWGGTTVLPIFAMWL